MSVAIYKVWADNETITNEDLVNSFLQILNNADDLASPATKAHDMNGFALILDGDADTSMIASTDDLVDFILGGVRLISLDGTTASHVNGFTLRTAITANAPAILARGADTNIDINLIPKGTGKVNINGAPIQQSVDSILAHRVFA